MSKQYAKKFPSDTPIEVYNPDNPPPGASQTPWLSDINGGGYSLVNVNEVTTNKIRIGSYSTRFELVGNTLNLYIQGSLAQSWTVTPANSG